MFYGVSGGFRRFQKLSGTFSLKRGYQGVSRCFSEFQEISWGFTTAGASGRFFSGVLRPCKGFNLVSRIFTRTI